MRKDIGCAGSMIESVDHFQPSPFSFSFRCSLLHSGLFLLGFITYQTPINAWAWRHISATPLAVFQGSSWQEFHTGICVPVSCFHYKLHRWNTEDCYSLQNCWFLSDSSLTMVSVWPDLVVMPPTSTVIFIPSVFPIHAMPLLPGFVFPFSACQLCPFYLLPSIAFPSASLETASPTQQSCVYVVHTTPSQPKAAVAAAQQ